MTMKSKKNRVSKSTLDKINQDIEALALTPPDDFSAKEAVRQSLPSIEKALANGRTMAQINEAFAKRGIQISGPTLATYVRMAQREKDASAQDLLPGSQKDEAQDDENTPNDPNINDKTFKPDIHFRTLDETDGPFEDVDIPNISPRSPDDDAIDEIYEERRRKALGDDDKNNG